MKKLPTSMLPEETAPRPEFPEQEQTPPGLGAKMESSPDHGETSYTNTGRLADKEALVTGGDSGIDRAVAIAFAREGVGVAISYLPGRQEDVDEVIALIKTEGHAAVALSGDIRSKSLCQSLVTDMAEQLGGLSILVSNARRQQYYEMLEELTTKDFDTTFKTNVYAPFWIIRTALPHLQAGSAIINTTSVQAYELSPILSDYAQTKTCLVISTRSLARQMAERGIRINAVVPGPYWMVLQSNDDQPDGKAKQFDKDTPVGHPGQPVEIAPPYVTPASDACSCTSGQVWCSDGGDGVVQARRLRADKRTDVMPIPPQHDRRAALRSDFSSPTACLAGCML